MKLVGRKDVEDALKRLDRLTHDEALMASAQILNLTHTIENKVDVVIRGRPSLSVTHPILIALMLARWKGHKVGSSANFEQRR